MSHFSVAIRVPAATALSDVPGEIERMLLPYKEQLEPKTKPFFKFVDDEDEYLKEYENETTECVRLPGGELVSKYEGRFYHHEGDPFSGKRKFVLPEGAELVSAPIKERYPTFEAFVANYHGVKKREETTGRYGHWENPNAKWDWYQIGGRWSDKLPVKTELETVIGDRSWSNESEPRKTNHADGCRLNNINWDHIAAESEVRLYKFWEEWQAFAAGKKFGFFSGPRDRAVDIGLVECKDANELAGDEWRTSKWERQTTPGVDRFDVLKKISLEDLQTTYVAAFNNLATYAALDGNGWRAPGKMGWFGVSSDEPEDKMAFLNAFNAWLRGGDQNDWLVIVDCHI